MSLRKPTRNVLDASSPGDQSDPILVIAYGNTLRRDDGAARSVAEELQALALPQIEVISCDLLMPELADAVSRAERVVFVDAEANSTGPARARTVVAAGSSQLMAHHASPSVILALARDVFGKVPPAWLVTIPGHDFGIGEELSKTALRGIKRALRLIQEIQLLDGCRAER